MMQPEGIEVCSILTKSWNYFKLINESYNHRNVESLELEVVKVVTLSSKLLELSPSQILLQ